MQNHKPHSQKAPQTGHSIFGTILFSLLAVLAVEILLLTFTVHATRLGPQLNQNAEDILAMQVDNRSRYLQSIFHDAQELTSLSGYHQWPDPAASGRGRDQPEHAGQQQRRGLSPAGSRRAGAHQHPAHQVGDRRVPYPEHP